jgi:hypothetical protein
VAAAKAKAIKDASAAAIAESAAKHKEAMERERRQAAQAEADRLAAEQIAQCNIIDANAFVYIFSSYLVDCFPPSGSLSCTV